MNILRKRKPDKSGADKEEPEASDNSSTVTSDEQQKAEDSSAQKSHDSEEPVEKQQREEHQREKERKSAGGGEQHKHDHKHEKQQHESHKQSEKGEKKSTDGEKKKKGAEIGPAPSKVRPSKWRCVDTCCWLIGYICVCWWGILVLYNALPALPQYVTEAITGPLPDPPGVRLAKEGLTAKHPVVFVPGIVTGGLELWEGKPCADGLFRKRLWGGTFGEVYKRPFCWMEHMTLDNETGMDLPGIRVRPTSGLVAADYFAPGYFVWAVLIENLARIGYEEKNMHMAAYDWRLSFQNTEVRDKALTSLKYTIEMLVVTNDGHKVVAVPHSMGSLYWLHFMKWVEAPKPMGGGGGPDWCARHVKAVINLAGPMLGVSKAFTGIFSAEAKDIAVARAAAPGVLDSEFFGLQTLQHILRVSRTWDATMSMLPKGGETIWGDADWSPEEGYDCAKDKKPDLENKTDGKLGPHGKPYAHYGRLVSFGKDAAQLPYSEIKAKVLASKTTSPRERVRSNASCGDSWTEYQELNWVDIEEAAQKQVYTAETGLDLLRKVAPRLMKRADDNWGYGIADNPRDPKYNHFKYWANPLESELPNAPEMEIYCMYGVGILTERSYIYKTSPSGDSCYIPFRIDTSVEGDSEGCLKGGVHFVDGDETVTALSAGFMCAKGWRGKTKYNPSGSPAILREFDHAPPSNLLEGRGTQSGSHVDIMGNFALIEDVLRISAGATGEEIGGDRYYSDILKWSERIKLKL
ncbi:unnamed protein product [Calypogeia fissa]